jgi:hypothetical protein
LDLRPPLDKHEIARGFRRALLIFAAILAIGLLVGPRGVRLPASEWLRPAQPIASSVNQPEVAQTSSSFLRNADLRSDHASGEVRRMADWVARSGDAAGTQFVIIDKRNAQLYVFGADGRLDGSTPILLGAAVGDETVPGIGSRPINEVLPEERTTPAGRFVGERGENMRHEDVVWVDYDAAVSMHRVLTTNPKERRLERLATPTSEDNRISYGCINVPVAFFEQVLAPAFAHHNAIVYVLPEVKSLEQVFAVDSTVPPPQMTRLLQVRQAQGG